MRFRGRVVEEPEINLVPLIDVLLVIIIFLMLATTFAKFSELQLTLPSADGATAMERPREINVAVSSDGRYAIDRVPVAIRDVRVLAEELRKAAAGKDDPVLIINADQATPHQKVVDVMEAARLAGLAKLAFATQRTTTK